VSSKDSYAPGMKSTEKAKQVPQLYRAQPYRIAPSVSLTERAIR
jgi:hypothetical protein